MGRPERTTEGPAPQRPQRMRPGDEAPADEPVTGEHVCPRCGGSGRRDGEACPNCGGSGRVSEGVGGG